MFYKLAHSWGASLCKNQNQKKWLSDKMMICPTSNWAFPRRIGSDRPIERIGVLIKIVWGDMANHGFFRVHFFKNFLKRHKKKVTIKSSKQRAASTWNQATTNLVEIPWTITTAVRPEKVQSNNGLWLMVWFPITGGIWWWYSYIPSFHWPVKHVFFVDHNPMFMRLTVKMLLLVQSLQNSLGLHPTFF